MARIGSIYVALDVDLGRMSKFNNAASVVDRGSVRMSRSLGRTNSSVTRLRTNMNKGMRTRIFGESLRTLTRTTSEVERLRSSMMALTALTGTGFTGALAGTYLLQTADRARLLDNQLRTVTDSTANLSAVQEKLYRVSQNSRSSFDATVKIYARTARATRHLGLEQEKLLTITETIQKSFAIGGASQQEAMGAAIQLSQGIASDRFSGEEYRSVAENAPVLLRGMADALDVNIGKLREMAHAGELTAEVVTSAILKAATSIDTDFNKTMITVGQSVTRLDNAFLMYMGNVDNSIGLTRKLSGSISNLAENFDEVAKYGALAVGVTGAIFGGKAISGMIGSQVRNYQQIAEANKQTLVSSQDRLKTINSEVVANKRNLSLAINKSRVARETADTSKLSATQIARMQRRQEVRLTKIASLRSSSLALSKAQIAASNAVNMAERRVTAAVTAGTIARRAGASVLGFLGGPVGIGFMAAIAAFGMYSKSAAEAEEQTFRVKKELRDLGLLAEDTADGIDSAAASLDKLAGDQIRSKIAEYGEEIDKLEGRKSLLDVLFGGSENALGDVTDLLKAYVNLDFGISEAGKSAATEMLSMIDGFQKGSLSVDDFTKRLDEITNIDVGERVDELSISLRQIIPEIEAIQSGIQLMETNLYDAATAGRTLLDQLRDNPTAYDQLVGDLGALGDRHGFTSEQRRLAARTEEQERYERVVKSLTSALDAENKTRDYSIVLSDEEITAQANQIIALEDGESRRRDALKESETASKKASDEAKKYREAIASLALDAKAAPLDTFYKQVISTARGLGLATEEMEQFIAAVSSGDMNAAPEKIKAIADAMKLVASASLGREIDHERDMLGMTPQDQGIYDRLSAAGIEYNSVQGQMYAGQIRFNDALSSAGDIMVSFWGDVHQNLKEGKGLWESLGDAAMKAGQSIIDMMAKMEAQQLAVSLMGAFSGGGGGPVDLIGNLFKNAQGNVFQSKGLSSYSNTVQNTPKIFPFAKGVGMFAEAGPEAIMPLGRTSGGDLGVKIAANENSGGRSLRVELYNEGGEQLQATSGTMDTQGGVDVARIILGQVAEGIAGGRFDGVLGATFGLNRRGR